MTDEQQPTADWTDPATPESAPLSVNESPNGTEPPPTKRLSRRMVLLLAGLGVSGAAALGSGAFAFYESQVVKQDNPLPGRPARQLPQGNASRVPRGDRSARPNGARPSSFPSGRAGREGFGVPSAPPTSQPS